MLIKELYANTMGIVSDNLNISGFTHQQIMVIKLISHNGQVTISQLCDEMFLAKCTMSGIVSRLESAGYVKKIKMIKGLYFSISNRLIPLHYFTSNCYPSKKIYVTKIPRKNILIV